MQKKIKILSLDGGGVKGVFIAKYLMKIESELKRERRENNSIRNHFDLIIGTSTGGLMAIALSLGISAKEIHDLYINSAEGIFGNKRNIFGQFINSSHSSKFLEKLIRNKFRETYEGKDPRLEDCKTHLCIPIYDMAKGRPDLLGTRYADKYDKTAQTYAFQAAMAAVAAPTYFNPYSGTYTDDSGKLNKMTNIVDGGIITKNPSLIGFLEASKTLNQPMSNIEILSIGTGYKELVDKKINRRWGIRYWLFKDKRRRLFEVFTQGQSQQVLSYFAMMKQGQPEEKSFIFDRIDTLITMKDDIAFDEYDKEKIRAFSKLASIEFEKSGAKTLLKHFYR